MNRRRLIVIGPLPPPVHGVTISTSLVLANQLLKERFSVEHLDTSDHRTLVNIGRWDMKNLVLGLSTLLRFNLRLVGVRGIVYLPLSLTTGGFLRDSLFIHSAVFRRWKVAAHLRGGEFPAFYIKQPLLLRWWIRLTLGKLNSMGVMGASLRGMFDSVLPSKRIAVIPNGTPDIARDGLERDANTVLFLSNFLARKGVVESVEAALLVLERRPTTQFLFVGSWLDADLERELQERARPAGDHIRFLPSAAAEEKRALLLSSSLLLFPPVGTEGHPRVVLEAIAAGLPVVTTNRGAIAETVTDGESGFVLDEPDPERLADRVTELLADGELRERMSRAARKRYLEEFTQEAADHKLAYWLDQIARKCAE